MEVIKGHGYLGVMLYDDVNDKVQCHICGLWYAHVGKHAQMKHKVMADDYKQTYGLTFGTALCSVGLSAKKSSQTLKCIEAGTIRQDIAVKAAAYNKKTKRKYRQVGIQTPQYSNRNGLCDLQIRHRYDIVRQIVGHEPTQNEIIKYDRKLFHCGIVPRWGNLNTYKEMIGVKPRERYAPNKLPIIEYVGRLRKFAKDNCRKPKTTDFKSKTTSFYRVFGSWSNALRTAGLK